MGNKLPIQQYSVYGEVAVEDANHTNPYMFAGVRYDIEIDLYTTVRGTIIRLWAVSCRPRCCDKHGESA